MHVRPRSGLRELTRRLPITGAYERRIAELTAEVHALTEQIMAQRAIEAARPHPWVPIGHYYSPIPDLDEIRRHHGRIFDGSVIDLPAVDLQVGHQWSVMSAIAPRADGVDFATTPAEARDRGHRYWSDNPGLAPADALALTMILRHHRPARLVELGSGYSSACTLDAREQFLDGRLELTFVDPYMDLFDELVHDHDRGTYTRIASGTQDVPLGVFDQLAAGDVLFIDSTHVARTGSDVIRIVFEILPALAPGVIVHVHDVFPGFEYPVPWVYEGRGWSEQYLLRAFLQYNESFRIHWWPTLLQQLSTPTQGEQYPVLDRLVGGSIWLEKIA